MLDQNKILKELENQAFIKISDDAKKAGVKAVKSKDGEITIQGDEAKVNKFLAKYKK
jgi:hypothetical protein